MGLVCLAVSCPCFTSFRLSFVALRKAARLGIHPLYRGLGVGRVLAGFTKGGSNTLHSGAQLRDAPAHPLKLTLCLFHLIELAAHKARVGRGAPLARNWFAQIACIAAI